MSFAVIELEELLPKLVEQGYCLIFAVESSQDVMGSGRVAGYGIHAADLLSISAYVPVNLRQTNNTAELYAEGVRPPACTLT